MRFNVKDGHAVINGNDTTFSVESGVLNVITEGGRALFSIRLLDDGDGVEITADWVITVGKSVLDEKLMVLPKASNCVEVRRNKYKP